MQAPDLVGGIGMDELIRPVYGLYYLRLANT